MSASIQLAAALSGPLDFFGSALQLFPRGRRVNSQAGIVQVS